MDKRVFQSMYMDYYHLGTKVKCSPLDIEIIYFKNVFVFVGLKVFSEAFLGASVLREGVLRS